MRMVMNLPSEEVMHQGKETSQKTMMLNIHLGVTLEREKRMKG
jgi:hypothetical protein